MVMKSSGLVDVLAECQDCDAVFDARNAQGVAAQHARRYGHTVIGHITYGFHYGLAQDSQE